MGALLATLLSSRIQQCSLLTVSLLRSWNRTVIHMLSVRFAGYYEQDAFARLRRNYRGCKNTPKWCVAVDSRTQTAMQESLAMNASAYVTRRVFHNAGHGLWQRLVALSCYASVPAGSSVTVMRSYPGNIEMWRREMTSVLDNFNFVMPSSTRQF